MDVCVLKTNRIANVFCPRFQQYYINNYIQISIKCKDFT